MYKRILLKLSGEALKEKDGQSIYDTNCLSGLSDVIASLHNQGVQVCVVIGAGNIWRGKLAGEIGLEPVPADFMGMLGTVINGVALSGNLKTKGVESVVTSAVPSIPGVTVDYSVELADKCLNEGKVVFLAGGTGKPFFTTDTAATMRAIELNCDAILMGKNGVEGVYSDDPRKNSNARLLRNISYKEILELNLQVMDISAVKLIQDKDIDIRVFSMSDPNNFLKVASGDDMGTTCHK